MLSRAKVLPFPNLHRTFKLSSRFSFERKPFLCQETIFHLAFSIHYTFKGRRWLYYILQCQSKFMGTWWCSWGSCFNSISLMQWLLKNMLFQIPTPLYNFSTSGLSSICGTWSKDWRERDISMGWRAREFAESLKNFWKFAKNLALSPPHIPDVFTNIFLFNYQGLNGISYRTHKPPD